MSSRDYNDPDDPALGLGGSSGIGGFAQDRQPTAERQRGRGRPPRVYRRSDERIRDDVYDRLLAQDWIDADDVRVAVQVGEVTLTGTVPTRQDLRDVEKLAEKVLGVRGIQNRLAIAGVEPGSGPGPLDQPGPAQSASPGKTRPGP